MKKLHKLAALVLVLATIVTAFAFPASAAYSSRLVTCIEDYLPIVTYATPLSGADRLYAYSDSSLTEETSSYIDTYRDKIVITDISISGRGVFVTYPTSSGTKSRWFKTDDILGIESVDIREYTAQHKFSVYRLCSPDDIKSYGYISVGDACTNLGRHSVDTNYYVTIYPISETEVNGITVRHKIALSPIAGYHRLSSTPCQIIDPAADKMTSSTKSTPREDEISAELEAMMNGTSHDGVYEVNTRYWGPRWDEQCKGFAKSVFEQLFGYNIGQTQKFDSGNNYKLFHDSEKTEYIGSVTEIAADSTEDLKQLFEQARPGDFVQMRRQRHGGSHSAIVVSVSSTKLTLVEANTDRNNGIRRKEYTWVELCDDNEAMSLYTAKDY